MLLVCVSKCFNHICELKTIHAIRHLTHVSYICVGEQVIISKLLILCLNEVLCGYTKSLLCGYFLIWTSVLLSDPFAKNGLKTTSTKY